MEWADRNYQANNNRPTVLCQHVRHSQSSGDICTVAVEIVKRLQDLFRDSYKKNKAALSIIHG